MSPRFFVVLLSFLVTPPLVWAQGSALQDQVKKLVAPDAESSDEFGVSVVLSGTTALVGAFRDDDGGEDAGSAYLFGRDVGGAGNWGQIAKLSASDAAAGDRFGQAVAFDGTTVVIGAPADDDAASRSGSAYVFEFDEAAGGWVEVAKLVAEDGSEAADFGESLAISGQTVLVGATRDDGLAPQAGAAYIFERDEGGVGNWGQVVKLTADAGVWDGFFGRSVALDGNIALVGSPGDDLVGAEAGAAFFFERDEGGAGNWGRVAKVTSADGEPYDQLGLSVALDGSTAMISAIREDTGGLDSGAVYVFESQGAGAGDWTETAKIVAEDAVAFGLFGLSLSFAGNTAVVGTPFDDDAGGNSGSAYVFHRNEDGGDGWTQAAKLLPEGGNQSDLFGWSVSLSGDLVLIGAQGFNMDEDNQNTGAAFLFGNVVTPRLHMPSDLPVTVGDVVHVPVQLESDGAILAATVFSIDYDESCLAFDPLDNDADGVPDAVTFLTPANFDTTVFFDLGDSDGEIDISISDAFTPAPLPDGVVVTVALTPTCAPAPPTTELVTVAFSDSPAASFSDVDAESLSGETENGSIKIFGNLRGDCSNDGAVDAADLVAGELEIFDGDGDFWLDVPAGSFTGLPSGCDANLDTVVDAGDLSCTSRRIFGLECAAPMPISGTAPRLLIPKVLVVENGVAVLDVLFEAGDSAVSAIAFALDFDETRLSFDATDADLDGIPDSVTFIGDGLSRQTVRFDGGQSEAELSFFIADLTAAPREISSGTLARLEFQVLAPGLLLEESVDFASRIPLSFGDLDGRSLAGEGEFDMSLVFRDGFETGDTSAWSVSAP